MNIIGTIASVIAAITGIIMIWNSKGCVVKRIERKERRIQDLKNQYYRTYGINAQADINHPIVKIIHNLQKSIDELKKHI